jgi:uncharacterized protein YgbK (DUF1537 family)
MGLERAHDFAALYQLGGWISTSTITATRLDLALRPIRSRCVPLAAVISAISEDFLSLARRHAIPTPPAPRATTPEDP